MSKATSRFSRTATIRFPITKLDALEAIGVEHGTNRHALIRACVYYAMESGLIAELAASAQKVKAPALATN